MNNKGFTLIELIATIALLGVLAVISFVSITGIIKKSKVTDCEALVSSIKSAAKEYASDNRYGTIDTTITAQNLISWNYLSSPVVNPFTDEEMNASTITITIQLNTDYSVKNVTIEAPLILTNCESGI